jgi:hypothetical protein
MLFFSTNLIHWPWCDIRRFHRKRSSVNSFRSQLIWTAALICKSWTFKPTSFALLGVWKNAIYHRVWWSRARGKKDVMSCPIYMDSSHFPWSSRLDVIDVYHALSLCSRADRIGSCTRSGPLYFYPPIVMVIQSTTPIDKNNVVPNITFFSMILSGTKIK